MHVGRIMSWYRNFFLLIKVIFLFFSDLFGLGLMCVRDYQILSKIYILYMLSQVFVKYSLM